MLLAVLVVLSIAFGQWQSRARAGGHTDAPSRLLRSTVATPSAWITSGAQSTADFLKGTFSAGALVRENHELKLQAEAAQLYDARVEALQAEIESLRKLQGYPNFPGKQKVAARLLGQFPNEYRLSLAAGSAEGVSPGEPVVAGNGLLALVQTVDSHTCQATLIWSPPPFKMGGIILGKPKSAGLFSGDGDVLNLQLSLDMPVSIGDTVVTSGFSEKIPRGIPIGRVSHVQEDADFGVERVTVVPSASLGDVQEVFILK